MRTKILKTDRDNPDGDVIRAAAAAIKRGKLVGLPTETVYGLACRAGHRCISALDKLKGRPPAKPYTVHIADPLELPRYVPVTGLKAKRLITHAWPGPLTIIFTLTDEEARIRRGALGPEVFDLLYANRSIGLRCPEHRAAAGILKQADCPVVAPSANPSGEEPPLDAVSVMAYFGGRIELVVDAGAATFGGPSTIVAAGPGRLDILRQGVLPRSRLEELSRVTVLFVCSGNTCRSPMAAAFWRQAVAEKLGCKLDELSDYGYIAYSAGLSAVSGLAASAQAIAACAAEGLDISGHKSRAMDGRLLGECDVVFAMTEAHCRGLASLGAGGKCLLVAERTDVPDPVGGSQEQYNRCAEIIRSAIRERVNELVR